MHRPVQQFVSYAEKGSTFSQILHHESSSELLFHYMVTFVGLEGQQITYVANINCVNVQEDKTCTFYFLITHPQTCLLSSRTIFSKLLSMRTNFFGLHHTGTTSFPTKHLLWQLQADWSAQLIVRESIFEFKMTNLEATLYDNGQGEFHNGIIDDWRKPAKSMSSSLLPQATSLIWRLTMLLFSSRLPRSTNLLCRTFLFSGRSTSPQQSRFFNDCTSVFIAVRHLLESWLMRACSAAGLSSLWHLARTSIPNLTGAFRIRCRYLRKCLAITSCCASDASCPCSSFLSTPNSSSVALS